MVPRSGEYSFVCKMLLLFLAQSLQTHTLTNRMSGSAAPWWWQEDCISVT